MNNNQGAHIFISSSTIEIYEFIADAYKIIEVNQLLH